MAARLCDAVQNRPMIIEPKSSPASDWRVLSDQDLRTIMQLARGTRRLSDATRA
jgi:hypothetical protein